VLGVLPAAAQTTGIQRTWLLAEETSQLGDLLFGPGVAEVTTASTGATTAGGTVSWVRYFEKDDHLGMHHVYYRQRYEHPQLGRALRVLGTAVALHYAPDGSLSRANLAQVDDVPPLPNVALTTPQQAFAAAHMGLASWPGFRLGDPARWPPGTLASILDRSELMLEVPRDAGSWRLVWRFQIPDADWEGHTALVDAATGELERVSRSNPHDEDFCPPEGCAHCSPGHDGMDPPVHTTAVAVAENPAITALREVAASPFADPDEQEENCAGSTCTHEAVSAQREGLDPENDPDIPQIEVYHGMKMMAACPHCGYSGYGFDEGKYMRVGLMEIGGSVRYDDYNPGQPGKALERCDAHDLYRLFAGDAMFYTQQTMEVFSSTFKRCGFDGSCGVARVVVDAEGYTGTAQFNVYVDSHLAPFKSVQLDQPLLSESRFSVSASLDTVAHEWGHAVDFESPGNFVARCPASGLETCEMMEGFAEVVGHVVERLKQTTADTNLGDDVYEAEHWDWTAQEDFALVSAWPILRRADRYSTNQCPGFHHSVHAEDAGCGWGQSANGNRLAVVLKLMTDGGNNPGAGHVVPCTGCDIDVTALDADANTAFQMAARILFRVFDTEADFGTVDWDELPVLARNAIHDLFWGETCVAAQLRTNNAFLAVGYPESGLPPCIHCRPYQVGQPPCCPPDYPCLGEEE